jgi:hypothetical protein
MNAAGRYRFGTFIFDLERMALSDGERQIELRRSIRCAF